MPSRLLEARAAGSGSHGLQACAPCAPELLPPAVPPSQFCRARCQSCGSRPGCGTGPLSVWARGGDGAGRWESWGQVVVQPSQRRDGTPRLPALHLHQPSTHRHVSDMKRVLGETSVGNPAAKLAKIRWAGTLGQAGQRAGGRAGLQSFPSQHPVAVVQHTQTSDSERERRSKKQLTSSSLASTR